MEMIYVGEPCHYLTIGNLYDITLNPDRKFWIQSDKDNTCSFTVEGFLMSFIHPSHYKQEGEQKPECEQKSECIYQVGDTVYHYAYGCGKVCSTFSPEEEVYSISVQFDDGTFVFTLDGMFHHQDKEPSLSFTPYDLKNGGFSQERPKPEPKIGDVGYFWDHDSSLCSYSKIEHIVWDTTYKYKPKFGNYCKNFSHEPPAYIKQ